MDTLSATRILLVDDQGIVRRAIKTLLQLSDPRLIVDEAATVAQATLKLETEQYAFSLVDLDLAGGETGFDVIDKMHEMERGLPAIVLSGTDDRETIVDCLRRGASGFITKASEEEDVFRTAIDTVLSGRVYLPSNAIGRGGKTPAFSREARVKQISELHLRPKLAETLAYVYQGLSNKAIARRMNIGEFTARDYCSELYREFGVAKRAELIVELARRGIAMSNPHALKQI